VILSSRSHATKHRPRRVLGFALILTATTSLLGTLPALRSTRSGVVSAAAAIKPPFAPQNIGQPTVAIAPDGTQIIFWQGAGGHLIEAWWNGSWNGPVDWTAANGWPASVSSAPSVRLAADGTQIIFWQGAGGHLIEVWWNGHWNGPVDWTAANGWPASVTSAPSVALAPGGTQIIFWQGAGGHLDEVWWQGHWNGPVDWTAANGWPASVTSAPSVAFAPDGTQLIFWKGAGGHLDEVWWNGKWNGPVDWTSANAWSPSVTSAPSVAFAPNGTQLIFWQGAGGHLDEVWWNGHWNGPVDWTAANGWGSPLTSAPSATIQSDGTQLIFWQGAGSHLIEVWWNGQWNGPVDWTANTAVVPQRDPFVQPFTSTSIWNMPIGSGAQYTPANLVPASLKTLVSDQHIIVMKPAAPPTALNESTAGWTGADRCVATGPFPTPVSAPIPDSFVVPSSTMNDPLVAVAADGHTLIQGEPFARCTPGSAGTLEFPDTKPGADLYGDGLLGFDGGSRLSALGGAIRLGELIPGGVIPHALQIDVDGWANLYPGTTSSPCYVWPATRCDPYSLVHYGGINPAMTMGALLALPQGFSISSLRTPAARVLATAFKNYGAYVANDASSATHERSVNNVVTEFSPNGSVSSTPSAPGEFQTLWGFPFETNGANGADDWSVDIATIFANLAIVTNNTSTSIGGGGTPLQPLAPPLQGP
jgi:hypothetical protein